MPSVPNSDVKYLTMAARIALRGHGGAEPNPLVGCVIVGRDGSIIGWGYHRTYGGPHAEVVALKRAGNLAAGATLYCTLEPCNHKGKTGPCTQAIIDAKIARVIIARRDPYPPAAGGVERLRAAGINVEIIETCAAANAVSEPFIHRLRTGLPWVTIKWAQTIDGKITTGIPQGEGRWISNQASRRMVHRERGRVDAIMTGIGTVLADDPMLTARDVRVRRIAKRVVIDPKLQIPQTARLVRTAGEVPTVIICDETVLSTHAERAQQLRNRGMELIGLKMEGQCLPMAAALRELVQRHEVATVLVEAGPGLMTRLFQHKLVNEAWVFIAPLILGGDDDQAKASITGTSAAPLTNGIPMKLSGVRRRDGDVILRYAMDW